MTDRFSQEVDLGAGSDNRPTALGTVGLRSLSVSGLSSGITQEMCTGPFSMSSATGTRVLTRTSKTEKWGSGRRHSPPRKQPILLGRSLAGLPHLSASSVSVSVPWRPGLIRVIPESAGLFREGGSSLPVMSGGLCRTPSLSGRNGIAGSRRLSPCPPCVWIDYTCLQRACPPGLALDRMFGAG